MWKFPGVPYKMKIFITLLSLIVFTRGETKTVFMDVMEGDEATLNFSFHCNSSKVTLRHGYRAPFYDSANPDVVSLPDRQEVMLYNKTEDNNCSLQLKVNPVLRSDEGGYILTAYDSGGNIIDDPRVGLRVDYPPGVASCEWVEENMVDDWGTMLCKAPAGSTSGQIACYQNGQRMPSMTTATDVGDVLQQTISVKYSQVVFCCAALKEKLIDICECKNFVWDPPHSENITNPTVPCDAPPQDSPPPQSLEEDHAANLSATTRFIPTPQIITERPARQNSLYGGLLVVIGTLVFIIIFLCVVLIVAFRKIRQLESGVIRQNGPYATVPAVEL